MSCDEDCSCNDGKLGCFALVLVALVLLMLIGEAGRRIGQLQDRIDKVEQQVRSK